jgi:hypothetical protein
MAEEEDSWHDRVWREVDAALTDADREALRRMNETGDVDMQALVRMLNDTAYFARVDAARPPYGSHGEALAADAASELGRNLIRLGRVDIHQLTDEDPRVEALHALRWGADDLDDDAVWNATLGALEEIARDDDVWVFGDGFVDETIKTRPELARRWLALYDSSEVVREVHRVMEAYTRRFHDMAWWPRPEAD